MSEEQSIYNAEMLEEEADEIKDICGVARCYAPNYDIESITEELLFGQDEESEPGK